MTNNDINPLPARQAPYGDQTTREVDDLKRRVSDLETRVSSLEARLAKLESQNQQD